VVHRARETVKLLKAVRDTGFNTTKIVAVRAPNSPDLNVVDYEI